MVCKANVLSFELYPLPKALLRGTIVSHLWAKVDKAEPYKAIIGLKRTTHLIIQR
jgi:hypothetical protein